MMVKAHSLLYALYICLIVALVCGAMLYIANLYNQLNLHYTSRSELYLHNQSLVNYALGNLNGNMPEDEKGIESFYENRPYGAFTLLTAYSILNRDTIASAHIVGRKTTDNVCLHVANLSSPLSYSGEVTLIGDKVLPSKNINLSQIDNSFSGKLTAPGNIFISERLLPALNPTLSDISTQSRSKGIPLASVEKLNDSVYYNSFLSPTIHIELSEKKLRGVNIKGNFILESKDSLFISADTILEDIIIYAPSVTIESGFTGTLQVFASKNITLGEKASLLYPSVLCLRNSSLNDSSIIIKKEAAITGAVIHYGFPIKNMDGNITTIEEGGLIMGDIFCEGMLDIRSDVYGSVYCTKLSLKKNGSTHQNCLYNIEINSQKKPPYFISAPLFTNKSENHGLLKKVF